MLPRALGISQQFTLGATARAQKRLLLRLCQSFEQYSTNTEPPEPVEMRISEDLLSKVKDKDLLRTSGFIGGKWTPATNNATYQVS